MNAFSMRFETLCGDKIKKIKYENVVFVNNFHFGKSVQNTGKNHLEINAFFMGFEILCGDQFKKKKGAKTVFL